MVRRHGEMSFVVAPTRFAARHFVRHRLERPGIGSPIRLTTRAAFEAFLKRIADEAFVHEAAHGLRERHPSWSASACSGLRRLFWTALCVMCAVVAPLASVEWPGLLVALWFSAFTLLRLIAGLSPPQPSARIDDIPDRDLPTYTVMAALYHEALSVAPLMRALDRLDYPREKLEIKLIVEADDHETRDAIAALGCQPNVAVITTPDYGPRTKPKALNYALPFARGAYVAVFDAEDRPEPNQLKAALAAFRDGGPGLACAQASLCIDNGTDGWLARMFTVEYAGQFDGFLPGLARFGAPLPLGGSSNHFRADILRDVGGWDAFNVTEDADLGMRLARCGYRTVTFASTTFEEAPSRPSAWLRQRSRWMKGWIQTWSVHLRNPARFIREARMKGFLTLNVLIGGNVLTALAHPVFLIAAMWAVLRWFGGASDTAEAPSGYWPIHGSAIVLGYVSSVIVGIVGLSRRGLLHHAPVLVLTPIYWMLLSLAAWRALYQFLVEPYRWEKTDHGRARRAFE
jgi:hypothetical protein